MYKTDGELIVENELIYERKIYGLNNNFPKEIGIFDLMGNYLGKTNNGSEISFKATDNDKYYMVNYDRIIDDELIEQLQQDTVDKMLEDDASVNHVWEIIQYDKEHRTITKVWESSEYDIDNLGYGLYAFSKYTNYSDVTVVDLVNLKVIK